MAASITTTLLGQCGAFFSSPDPDSRAKLRRVAEPALVGLAAARLDMSDITAVVKLLPSLVALSGCPSYDKVLLQVHGTILTLLSSFPLSDLPEAVVAAAEAGVTAFFSLLCSPEKWVSHSSSPSGDAHSHFGEAPHVVMVAAAVLHGYMDWLVPLQATLVVETNWHAWMAAGGSSAAEADAAVLGHITRWLEQAAARQMYQGKGKQFKDEALNTNAELRVNLIRLAGSLVRHPCSRAIAAGAWYSLVVCVAGRIGEPHSYRRDGLVCVEALRFLTLLGNSGPLSRFTWVGIVNRVVVRVYPTTPEEALRMATSTMEERRKSWEAFGRHSDSRSVLRVVSTDGGGVAGDTGGSGGAVAEVEPMRAKDGLPLYFSDGLRASFDLLLAALIVPDEALDAAAVGNLVGPLNALFSVSVRVPCAAPPSQPYAELFHCVSRVFAPKFKVPDVVLARLYRSLCANTRFLVDAVALLTETLRTACWGVGESSSLQLATQCVTSLCEVLTWVLVAVLEEHRNSSHAGTVACAPAHRVSEQVGSSLAEAEEVVSSFFYRLQKDSLMVDFHTQLIKAHLLNLLLSFVTDAVLTVGVADDGAWLHSTRQQLYRVAGAVDRCVDRCVRRSPSALVDEVEEKLDGVSETVAPFVRRTRSLLPRTDAKRLASSGASRLFDVMCNAIILF